MGWHWVVASLSGGSWAVCLAEVPTLFHSHVDLATWPLWPFETSTRPKSNGQLFKGKWTRTLMHNRLECAKVRNSSWELTRPWASSRGTEAATGKCSNKSRHGGEIHPALKPDWEDFDSSTSTRTVEGACPGHRDTTLQALLQARRNRLMSFQSPGS